jgi:tape measure domain-containing protein
MAGKAQLKLDLIVDDKGSVVVKGFSDKTSRYLSDGAKSVESFTSKLMSMHGVLLTLAGGYGLAQIAGEALDVAASFEQMEIKLDALTKGRGTETLDKINKWALDMPVNTRKAVDTFTMMQAMGLDPTIAKMQTLVDVSSIFGEETMPRVARALGQMATLGKLSAEELNQMSEAGINARKYLTEAFGMTVEELQKSQHSIEEIIDAIWKGLDADYSGAAKAAMDSWAGLTATFKSYMEEMARVLMDAGVFEALKEGMGEINDELKEWIENNKELLAQDVGAFAGDVATVFGALAKTIQFSLSTMQAFLRQWNDFVHSMKLGEVVGDMLRAVDDLSVAMRIGNFKAIQEEWEAINKEAEKYYKEVTKATGAVKKLAGAMKEDGSAYEPFAAVGTQIEKSTKKAKAFKGEFAQILDMIKEADALAKNARPPEEYIDFWRRQAAEIDAVIDRTQDLGDAAFDMEDVWKAAFESMGSVVDDLLVGLITGTNDFKDLFIGVVSEVAAFAGTAAGLAVTGGNPIGGFIGGTLGKLFGAGIDAIFGGEATKYEETTGAKVGWTGTGFDVASGFSASNEYGGGLASSLNQYINTTLKDINDQIAAALEYATPEQAAQIAAATGGIDLGALYNSGFYGFSISEQSKDRGADLDQIINHIQGQIDAATGGLMDLAGSIETAGEAAGDAADVIESEFVDLSRTIGRAAVESVRGYDRMISDIERQAAADISPWSSLRGGVSSYAMSAGRGGWGAADYAQRLGELTRADEQSLTVLQEQFDVLKQIEQLTQQEVQQNEVLIASLGDTILRVTGGDLAAVQSAGFYGSRYSSLLSSARGGDQDSATALNAFVSEYLDFMGSYGGNYKDLTAQVVQDLTGVKEFFETGNDLATNEMLLQTSMSTNDLLSALLHKSDETIAAIRADAAAATAAAGAAKDAEIAAAIGTLKSSLVAQGVNPTDFAPYADQMAQQYLAANPDVNQFWYDHPGAGGASNVTDWAKVHYSQHGQGEGRNFYSQNFETWARGYLGLASGGSFPGGSVRVVGEAGPELAYFKKPGTVISNQDVLAALSQGGGGKEIVVHTHVHLSEREIGRSVAKQMHTNRDLITSVQAIAR